jgi:soluble lytic murein transglycosylase-like protein
LDTRRHSRRKRRAISPKGAIGLMQPMPGNWANLQVRYGLGRDPFDPHDNILAGDAFLREMFDRYGSPGFPAAYNAGPAATTIIATDVGRYRKRQSPM